ncbi:YceD family protein [Clostridium formicaceticum]|uniref:DNA-binding protein n=1 Tax=Clostridium formicaceticum TaxID=1497 RepID=A0AAC9WGK2_9CLOT|nr:DUF177 domain-containing protein [Clostridium formicaceticum]AOY77355.1 hypothetical protein BJL90_16745 [Clostridium formicaceticum]ARE87899.1 hypothetical protein CLFO_22990 [Clostridium formicaceticum]
MLKFDLNTIKRGEHDKLNIDFTVDLDNINYYGDVLKVIRPIHVLGTIYSVGKKIFLSCNIETELEVHCGRCLKPFTHLLKNNIDVELVEEEKLEDNDDLEDIAIYRDNSIDFNEMIKEQIIMNLPMKVVCSEDCKGLCKTCGKDLNLEECKCNQDSEDNIDPRFAKLKELLQQD